MNILKKAIEITQGNRNKDYGDPKENHEHIAKIASAILKRKITAKEVVFILMAVKLSREINKPKTDNYVDLAGYSWVLSQVTNKRVVDEN